MAVKVNKKKQDPRHFNKLGRLNKRGLIALKRLVRQHGTVQGAAIDMGLSGGTAWNYANGKSVPR